MLRLGAFLLLIVGFIAVICPPVFALASEYDLNRPIGQQPEWPGGVADLLNSQKPAYAYFVNFQDNFYYSGDAASFNAFMERYGKLEGVPHTLVLHCGKGEVKELMKPKTHAFDWYVFVVPPMIPDGGIDKNSHYKRYVTANLYLGCSIQLSEIKVPANVKVVAGNEIEKFVKKHEAEFPSMANRPEPVIFSGARPALSPVSIYLAEDEKLTAIDALKMDLREIKLQWKPLFTLDDFICYSWEDHSFLLTPEAVGRLPKPRVFGVPFVLLVNGERIYLGAFWTAASSASFPNPVILTDSFLMPSQGNRLIIERAYPGVTPDLPKDDPRDFRLLREAFKAAGKLDVCGIPTPEGGSDK